LKGHISARDSTCDNTVSKKRTSAGVLIHLIFGGNSATKEITNKFWKSFLRLAINVTISKNTHIHALSFSLSLSLSPSLSLPLSLFLPLSISQSIVISLHFPPSICEALFLSFSIYFSLSLSLSLLSLSLSLSAGSLSPPHCLFPPLSLKFLSYTLTQRKTHTQPHIDAHTHTHTHTHTRTSDGRGVQGDCCTAGQVGYVNALEQRSCGH